MPAEATTEWDSFQKSEDWEEFKPAEDWSEFREADSDRVAVAVEPTESPTVAGLKGAWEALNKPFVEIPRVTGEEVKRAAPFLSRKAADVIAGVQRGTANLIEGVENPLGVITGGAGVAGAMGVRAAGAIAKAGAAMYGGLMAKQLPESAAQTEVAFGQGDLQTGVESAIGTVAGAVLVPTIAGHLAPVPRPKPAVPFIEQTSKALGEPAKTIPVEAEVTAPLTTEAISELPVAIKEIPAPQPGSGIAQLFSVGKGGATEVLYEKIFEALQKGSDKVSGVTEPLIPKLRPFFERGEIKSGQDISQIVQSGFKESIPEDMGAVLIDAQEMAAAKVKGLKGFTDTERDIMAGKLEDWVREEAEKFQAKEGTLDKFLPQTVIETRTPSAIEFVRAQKRGGEVEKVELDRPTEEGGTVGEAVPGQAKLPVETMAEAEVRSQIMAAISELPKSSQSQVRAVMEKGGAVSAKLAAELRPLLEKRGVTSESLSAFGISFSDPLLTAAAKKLQGKFTAAGGLPPEVHQLWIQSRGLIGSETKALDYQVRDLYSALRKEYGISWAQTLKEGMRAVPEDVVRQINDALLGDAPITSLPARIQAPVEAMRQHVDRLSQTLIDRGLIDPELASKVESNLGTYLTRSYRIFDQKDYAQKVPPAILDNARSYLLSQMRKNDPNATPAMADTKMREMLADWSEGGVQRQFGRGKLGAKDLTQFMARKDLAPEIRALLGEYKDPVVNYARSVTKIARFIGDQEFLNDVREVGLGEFLFEEGKSPPGWEAQLAAPESSTMSPLNGLRTSPAIKEAFETFNKGVTDRNFVFKLYFALNGASKAAKTVFSGLTQIRNLVGQPFFNLMNGHWNPKPYGKSIKAIAADIGVSDSAKFRDYYRRLTELGLTGESAPAAELKAILQDAGLKDSTYEDVAATGWARVLKKGVEAPIRAYQISDEIGKIVGFENEKARQSKIHPEWTPEQVEREAATRIRNGYPTYSMVSPWAKSFRQQPFFGPFVSFSYEVFRTSYHTMRYALDDLKSGNAEQVKAGAARVAGIMTALGSGYGLAHLSRIMFQIGDKQDDDIRRFLPPWSKNAQLIYLGKSEDGKIKYVNWSYQNPYSYLTDPMVALMREDETGLETKFWNSVKEFFAPFTDEQILSAAVVDILRNKTQTGQQVHGDQDTPEVKFEKRFKHLAAALEPGTMTRLRKRMIPAVRGDQPLYGRSLDPVTEIGAEVTGVRMEQFDFKQGLSFNIHRFRKDEDEAEHIFRGRVFKSGRTTPEDLVIAYQSADEARYRLWTKIHGDIEAAQRNGVPRAEIIRMLRANGVGREDTGFLLRGRYSPLKVSAITLQRARELKRQLPMQMIEAIRRERAKLPL